MTQEGHLYSMGERSGAIVIDSQSRSHSAYLNFTGADGRELRWAIRGGGNDAAGDFSLSNAEGKEVVKVTQGGALSLVNSDASEALRVFSYDGALEPLASVHGQKLRERLQVGLSPFAVAFELKSSPSRLPTLYPNTFTRRRGRNTGPWAASLSDQSMSSRFSTQKPFLLWF